LSIATSSKPFTEKQGQYLAFIHAYVQLNGRAPAEADMEKFFRVTAPSVHRMVVELERRGLIRRVARQARTIELCVSSDTLPHLTPQPIKTSGSRY
jgi:Mn-dependent DtxR family transcriptional regulator